MKPQKEWSGDETYAVGSWYTIKLPLGFVKDPELKTIMQTFSDLLANWLQRRDVQTDKLKGSQEMIIRLYKMASGTIRG